MLAISVENVSKVYRLGEINRRQLIQDVKNWVLGKKGRGHTLGEPSPEEKRRSDQFWALKNVSFQIKEGETVGIVGANGAGKSTLLKLISRITSPSEGVIRLNGRVGSLLEVGTGFNPELTGRDNVYLNGAILGMSRTEIASKFDDIVSFSGVEKFIDTPVKRYSSGMFVRLAFGVAAFLEPEVLIIDEVLSVGDQAFQNRCTERIQTLIKEGRTILFVSHNAALVERICGRAICLNKGEVAFDGAAPDVLKRYADANRSALTVTENLRGTQRWDDDEHAPGDNIARLLRVSTLNREGKELDQFGCGEQFHIEIEFRILENFTNIVPAIQVYDGSDLMVFTAFCTDPRRAELLGRPGRYVVKATIPANLLSPGTIRIAAFLNSVTPPMVHAHDLSALRVTVAEDFSESSARGIYQGVVLGAIRPKLEWSTRVVA
jgi:lipopolysaccharide transport system ATP-binding protein